MNQDDIDPNKKYVNGPLNIIRLEGKIGNTDKVLYVIADYHVQLENQTACSNIYADELHKYILNNMLESKKNNKYIDFFLEIDVSTTNTAANVDPNVDPGIDTGKNSYTKMYLERVREIFVKLFNYDKEKHKVLPIKFLENMRIHYADFRVMFDDKYTGMLLLKINHYISFIYDSNDYRITNAIVNLKRAKEYWISFHNIVKQCIHKKNTCGIKHNILKHSFRLEEFDDVIKYLFNKMIHKYKHPGVKKIMNKILLAEIKKIPKITKMIDEYISLLNDQFMVNNYNFLKKRNPSYSIKNDYSYNPYHRGLEQDLKNEVPLWELSEKIRGHVSVLVTYMDVFFMRRFLDKDYITNGVVYTGGLHSANYVKVLVDDFDFKITHVSNNNGLTVDKLNEKIKKSEYIQEIEYLIFPNTLSQCSDVTSFPKNFE